MRKAALTKAPPWPESIFADRAIWPRLGHNVVASLSPTALGFPGLGDKTTMRLGILGSGLMGGKLGTIFARAGHEVVFSYARSERKLEKLAREAKGKARPGTPREAAQQADAVLLAVHWSRLDDVLNRAGDLSGKLVVTCSLPMNDDNSDLVIAHTSSGAEELAKRIPKARVVSAVNTVP
ncbi:MAG TPA: NAD(P)-binding domain-containing protein, partial [Alphaproteobacteria bacterium]